MYLWEGNRGSPYVLLKHRLQRSNQHLVFSPRNPNIFPGLSLPNNLLPIDHAPPHRTRD